jgi:hypothetical protein
MEPPHSVVRSDLEPGAGCAVENHLGIDAVGTVEIGDFAGLAKTVDSEQDYRCLDQCRPGVSSYASLKDDMVAGSSARQMSCDGYWMKPRVRSTVDRRPLCFLTPDVG